MDKIILMLVKIISRICRNIINLLNNILFYLNVIRDYLGGYECKKFKDCILLQKLKKTQPPASDRFIEYPWMLENITLKEGRLLDIGSTIGDNLYHSLPKTMQIHCLNLNDTSYKNKEIAFKQGDIRKTEYPDNYFDYITCISTLEHIGVEGRYNSDNDPDGDTKAMKEIKRILKPEGTMLITVPYGIKDVLPINKLYNKSRINRLFNDVEIINQKFYKFSKSWGVWLNVTEEEAAKTNMLEDKWYAICLINAKKH